MRLKVSNCHKKISDFRKGFLHKVSTKLIRKNQTICVENLAINSFLTGYAKQYKKFAEFNRG
jgi:putative transposase